MVEIEPLPQVPLAPVMRAQLPAWLVVSQMSQPPVQRCWRLPRFIVNGAMNRKPLLVIPVFAAAKEVPPLVDFCSELPVLARNSTSFAALASLSVSTAV